MSWEWSHSEDAYSYAEERLRKLNRNVLLEIAAAWKYTINCKAESAYDDEHEFDEADEVAPPFVAPCDITPSSMNKDALATWIWEQASSWDHGRSCSNGGHELYLDPDGCHTVDLRDMPKNWSPEDY